RICPAKGWPPVKGRSLSLIPWSIDNYVTGVSERSQQNCNLKDDRYKTIHIFFTTFTLHKVIQLLK
ncbi:hypothetical protein, partial [Xenorhabdus koppenhoeferi]|uniref:hypothetical protein n=1 Tax=Xenorhabdus koppenhoeferi TaxID=351659 RepID=UPI002B4045C6